MFKMMAEIFLFSMTSQQSRVQHENGTVHEHPKSFSGSKSLFYHEILRINKNIISMYVLPLLVLLALFPPIHPATRGPLSPGLLAVPGGPTSPSWSSLFMLCLKSPASQNLIVYTVSVNNLFLILALLVFFFCVLGGDPKLKRSFDSAADVRCQFVPQVPFPEPKVLLLPVTKVLILTFCGEYEGIPEFNEDILRCILSFLTVRVASRLQLQILGPLSTLVFAVNFGACF